MSERLGDNQTRREAGQLYENVTLGSDNKVKKCDADDVVTYHDLEVLLYFQFWPGLQWWRPSHSIKMTVTKLQQMRYHARKFSSLLWNISHTTSFAEEFKFLRQFYRRRQFFSRSGVLMCWWSRPKWLICQNRTHLTWQDDLSTSATSTSFLLVFIMHHIDFCYNIKHPNLLMPFTTLVPEIFWKPKWVLFVHDKKLDLRKKWQRERIVLTNDVGEK